MTPAEARRRFARERVARLATTRPDGRPHVVPVTFAMPDADTVVWAVDHKPKRTTSLQRLRNIGHQPAVSLLVDHYEADWSRLWWVRADGRAVVHERGEPHRAAVDALAGRYPAYRRTPPRGPVVRITVSRWSGWAARDSALP